MTEQHGSSHPAQVRAAALLAAALAGTSLAATAASDGHAAPKNDGPGNESSARGKGGDKKPNPSESNTAGGSRGGGEGGRSGGKPREGGKARGRGDRGTTGRGAQGARGSEPGGSKRDRSESAAGGRPRGSATGGSKRDRSQGASGGGNGRAAERPRDPERPLGPGARAETAAPAAVGGAGSATSTAPGSEPVNVLVLAATTTDSAPLLIPLPELTDRAGSAATRSAPVERVERRDGGRAERDEPSLPFTGFSLLALALSGIASITAGRRLGEAIAEVEAEPPTTPELTVVEPVRQRRSRAPLYAGAAVVAFAAVAAARSRAA